MRSKLRNRLSYANVMATIAVFVALGGSSYAAITVTGKNVKNSSLTGIDIKNSSLTTSDVKNRSLLAADFKSGELPSGAQGPAGERGPAGATGPRGPARFADVLWAWARTARLSDGGCTQTGWRECAPVTVTVPAGATYKVAVTSSGSYMSLGAELPNRMSSCVSVRRSDVAFQEAPTTPAGWGIPDSCDDDGLEGISWERDAEPSGPAEPRLANLTTTGTRTLTGGAAGTTYTVASAIWTEKVLSTYSPMPYSPRVQTMVEIADVTP